MTETDPPPSHSSSHSSSETRAPRERSFSRPHRPMRNRSCPFLVPNAPEIDYKNLALLQRFLSERGKIVPARLSGVSRKKQSQLATAVKRARYLALLPYVAR